MNKNLFVRSFLILVVFVLNIIPSLSFAQGDHPLVTRYEGSEIKSKKVDEFGEYKLMTGFTKKGALVGEKLEGKVTRMVYLNPKKRSTLEIFRNYRKALEKAGLYTIFTCENEQCGPAFSRSAWGRFNGLFAASDGDPRYFSGKLTTKEGTAYVAIMVGKLRSQLDIVEIVSMQEERVIADAGALIEGIEKEGKALIYGLYFDTDKSVIKPESKPALEEIVKLLNKKTSLKLYVIGHTDMTGTLTHNLSLSEARARAVVKALVNDYGVKAGRLEGHGVGPLAPVATNLTVRGRVKNRRVELVRR